MDVMMNRISGYRCVFFMLGTSAKQCNGVVIMQVGYFSRLFISVTSDYGE